MTRSVAFDFDTDDGIAIIPEPKPLRYPSNDSPIKKRHYELKEQAQHTSNSIEHCTPMEYVEAARFLMGDIDLDPASNWLAQKTVKAESWFGIQKDGSRADGLMPNWQGRVFLNPPGGHTSKHAPHLCSLSKSYACIWWGKLVSEYESGRVSQAVFLGFTLEMLVSIQKLPNVMHPTKFPMCIPSSRIQFDYPEDTKDGKPDLDTRIMKGTQPTHGNFIVWLPPKDRDERNIHFPFQKVFGLFGLCISS